MEIKLKTNEDYKIWVVADLHLGHNKSFILNPRKYKAVEEAYEHTYEQLHAHVGPNDILINIGDAVIGAGLRTMEYAKRLVFFPCKKQYYLWGNHNAGIKNLYDECRDQIGLLQDKVEIYPLNYPGSNFVFCGDRLTAIIDGLHVVFDHYPIASWNHISKGAFMVHGHCHRNLPDVAGLRRLDVGWDWLRRPVEWSEIVRELSPRKLTPVDHHGTAEFILNEQD